jgi:hypothetical protein
MRIIAQASQVSRKLKELSDHHGVADWHTRRLTEPSGREWTFTYLGSIESGVPILIDEPNPTPTDLLRLAATSTDPAETAAAIWILWGIDRPGDYREHLLVIAETAATNGDRERAVIIVGWGTLTSEANLRPTIGKTPAQVTADHEHFKAIAARARALLRLEESDPPLRDSRVFGRATQ